MAYGPVSCMPTLLGTGATAFEGVVEYGPESSMLAMLVI